MFQAWWETATGNYSRNDGSGYCGICVKKKDQFQYVESEMKSRLQCGSLSPSKVRGVGQGP